MPLAYVPMINTEFSDRMNLKQRTLNLINYLVQQAGTRFGLSFMDPLVQKYVDPNKGKTFNQKVPKKIFHDIKMVFRIL